MATNGIPVVVLGDAGAGKSTLIKWITYCWTKSLSNDYDFILMAKLKEIKNADNLFDICFQWMTRNCAFLKHKNEQDQFLKIVQSVPPERVILLLDGLDECQTQSPDLQKLYEEELFFSEYPVVITTRAHKATEIQCNHHSCFIQPLKLNQQLEFIEKYFAAQDMSNEAKKFQLNMKQHESLQKATKTPMLLLLSLISGYFTEKFNETELYISLCTTLVSTYCKGHNDSPLTVENWMKSDIVRNLGKLAMNKLQQGEMVFSEQDLEEYNLNPYPLITIGLLKSDHERRNFMTETLELFYSFLHSTFQEFFAAVMLYNSYITQSHSQDTGDELQRKFEVIGSDAIHQVRALDLFGQRYFQVIQSNRSFQDISEFQQFLSYMQNEKYSKVKYEQTVLFLIGLLSLNYESSGIRSLLFPNQLDVFPTEQEDLIFTGKLQDHMRWDDQIARVGLLQSAKFRGHTLVQLDSEDLFRNFFNYLEHLSEGIFLCKDFDGVPFIVFDGNAAREKEYIPKEEFLQTNKLLNQYEYFIYTGSEKHFAKFAMYLGIFMKMQHLKLELYGDSSSEITEPSFPPAFIRQLWISTKYSNNQQIVPNSLQNLLLKSEKLDHVSLTGPRNISYGGMEFLPLSVTRLSIHDAICDTEAMTCLCKALKNLPSLNELTLKNCLVDANSGVAIIYALSNSSKLRAVDFTANKCFSKNLLGVRKLFMAVRSTPQIEELRLIQCDLSNDAVQLILDLIPKSLKRCGLGWNNLGFIQKSHHLF